MQSPLSRREALGVLGAFGVVAVSACSPSTKQTAARAGATATSSTRAGSGVASCTLAPELAQGPFFLTDHPNASNLVQDRKGRRLTLRLAVAGRACGPIRDVKVDVWHCDAAGVYAGINGGGGPAARGGGGPAARGGGAGGAATRGNPETWLQGYQTSRADGTVTFTTIYPGWYPGHAVHIHVKVFDGTRSVHTGQLFFPDALSDSVFAEAPYRGKPDTPNNADSIFAGAGSAALLAPKRTGNGFTADARLVVNA